MKMRASSRLIKMPLENTHKHQHARTYMSDSNASRKELYVFQTCDALSSAAARLCREWCPTFVIYAHSHRLLMQISGLIIFAFGELCAAAAASARWRCFIAATTNTLDIIMVIFRVCVCVCVPPSTEHRAPELHISPEHIYGWYSLSADDLLHITNPGGGRQKRHARAKRRH